MDEDIKKQRSTILQLYILFILALVGSFMPHVWVFCGALILFLVLIIAVPIYQFTAPDGSLLKNHMRYLNGTIWWGSLFFVLSLLIMGYWVYLQSDQSAFIQFFDKISNGFIVTQTDLEAMLNQFFSTNRTLIMQASLVCIVPPLLYVAFRVSGALSRALKGHRMGKTGS